VIKLGGGLDPHMLSRGHHIGKRLYSTAVQRRFLHGAAAIILVTESEREDLETYLPGYDGLVEVIANPVDSETLTTPWKPREGTRRAVFLGRFDPAHKGLDRIVYYATALPDTQFDCYGSGDRNRRVFEQLQESAPPNVSFHEPIFGTDKNDVLSLATIYLHPARWEAFGISIAEAMWAGVPCAVGADIALAPLIRQRELGVVLSRDNARAAEQLRGYVRDRERLAAVSARGKDYAHRHFDPAHVAQRYESMYRSCLSSGASSTS
jgi:glycosyltransferase involved in cell wall biosynthesis